MLPDLKFRIDLEPKMVFLSGYYIFGLMELALRITP